MQNYKNIFSMFLILFLMTILGANSDENERKKVLKKLKKYPYLLAYIDEKYKDDEELVMVSIQENGRILEYASKRLQNNEKLVNIAVCNNGAALAYASERLKDDDDIVSMAIDSYGTYLEYASTRLQDDDDIVMDALRSNGANLEHASKRFRDERRYVFLAIKNNSSALEYASKRLQNDRDLVLLSVRTYSSNLAYASKNLQDDKEIVLEAIKQDGRALRYASKRLKNNKEVVTFAIKKDIKNLAYASKGLQNEFGFSGRKSIEFEFNKNIEDLTSVPLGIYSSLELKSIEIKQENKIIAYYKIPKDEPVDYYIALNLSNKVNRPRGIIKIEIEEKNGKKYQIKKNYILTKTSKRVTKKYKSSNDKLNSITEQKYKRYILKLRIKDELAYGAFMVMHPMLKSDYIKHVVGKIGNRVIFDFYASAILRTNPFFRFTFNAPKKSGKLEIIVTDNKGRKRSFYKAYEL